MNKKIKKAYKVIEKYEKKMAKKALKNDFRMYEDARGCTRCDKGQIISGGGDACSVTYFERCPCSKIFTKRYLDFMEEKDELMLKMNAKEFNDYEAKWYDNNSHITVGNNFVDRSW